MDEIRKQEKNYKEPNEENQKDRENEEYRNDTTSSSQKIKESESNYRAKKNKINSISQGNQRAYTHSRSRSPCTTKNSKQWISTNPFINFVQDFRQDYVGIKSTRIFQLAGERWRTMPSEEKQPYIKASMNIKNKKQNHQKIENIKKSDINTEKIKKKNAQKQEPIKKPRKKRAPKKTPKKKNTTESDSDSYTSDTAGTNTSEDLSDVSS